ncbi:MAG: energy transducer TonB [Woeseiaceae bacterium]
MLSRYFVSFNFAALITFGLFYAMQMLISQGDIIVEEKYTRPIIVFDDIVPFDPPKTRERPPVIDEIKEIPVIPKFKDGKGKGVGPTTTEPNFGKRPDLKIGKVQEGLNFTDSIFIVLVKPNPQYPVSMSEKGIEGYVRVKYTVTALGNTEDVIAVESSHRGFERNAVKAVEKFKFKPQIEDGKAIAVMNVYNIIEFKLEN